MGTRPEDRKKKAALQAVSDDLGGDLFDLELDEVPEDPIFQMRKTVTHFRLMVLSPSFPHIHPGQRLTYGKEGAYSYPEGFITEEALIRVPRMGDRMVTSLTAFGTLVTPDSWTKTSKKTGHVSKPAPDGWNRVWASLDNGGELKVEDVMFRYYADLGYTVEQLSDIEFIQSELNKMGHASLIADLGSELKAYKTGLKKASEKKDSIGSSPK